MSATGHILFVWQEAPPATWPEHYAGACVKVSDGNDTGHAGQFGWAANYEHWVNRFGTGKVAPWTVPYPQDGAKLATTIRPYVAAAPYIVLDVEDWPHVTWTDQAIRDIMHGMRATFPGKAIAYCSYPTRKQCLDHHINQPLWDSLCDFSVPQTYYPYQREAIGEVLKDNKHPHVAVSPDDDQHWTGTAAAGAHMTGGVFYWRMGVAGWDKWPTEYRANPPAPSTPPPVADPIRPTGRGHIPAGSFIAWDGHGWYVTDLLHRRPLTQATVVQLHGMGVPVVAWPEVVANTVPTPTV